jgi:hypothetical protein
MPETPKASRAQTEREQDIIDLRDKIGQHRASEAVKREAADNFVDECKRAGLEPIKGLSDADKDAFRRIDKAFKEADEQAEIAVELESRLSSLVVTTGHEADHRSRGDLEHPDMRRTLSMADKFMASEDYRALSRSGALDHQTAPTHTQFVPVQSRDQLIATLFPSTHKAFLTGVDPLIPEDQSLFPPIMIPQRALRVRDLVNVATTDTDTIEYVVETTHTDAVVETSYGAAALESNYVYERREVNVKRLPHFVKATKGNLADQGQLRGLLDNNLVYGVGKRLDGQLVNGLGTGDNLRGILETVGLQDVDGSFVGGDGAENVPDAFHLGMTAVRLSLEDEPTAFLVHPDTYQQFVLAKGTDGHYLNLQGPQLNTPPNMWGLPAVVSTVLPSSSALVGNWRVGATLWVRSGISLAVTDSDSDDFRKGIITILAEMRAAFAVVEPKAFCEITQIGVTS